MSAIQALVGISAAIAGAVLAGWGVLDRILGGDRAQLDSWGRLSFSFLTGIATIVLWMILLSFAGIRFSAALSAAPAALGLLALRARRPAISLPAGDRPAAPALLPRKLSGLLLAGAVAACVAGSLAEPIAEVDAVAAWALHAKVFFIERTAFPPFLTEGATGEGVLHWPPLVPLAQTWGHLMIGRFDDRFVKLIYVAFYAALLGTAGAVLRRLGGGAWGRALLVPLATVPAFIVPFPAGSVASAYSDVPLAAFLAGTAAALLFWALESSRRWLLLAALLAASASWVKREGIAFGAVATGCVWIFGILGRGEPGRSRGGRVAPLVLFTAIVAASMGLQAVYKSRFPGPFTGEAIATARLLSGEGAARLGVNLANMLAQAAHPARWGILWILLAALALARAGRLASRASALALALLAGQILAGLVGLTMSPFSLERLAQNDVRRVLLHVAPIAALAIGVLAAPSERAQARVTDPGRDRREEDAVES